MTTLNEARETIYARFVDEWVDGSDPLTPFCFDNESFDPPNGDDGRGAPWARCSVRSLFAGQETLGKAGNRKFMRTAIARIEIFVPPGEGTKNADTLLITGKDMFEGRSTPSGTTIRFNEVVPREIGIIENGRWHLSTIEASFEYDEIK